MLGLALAGAVLVPPPPADAAIGTWAAGEAQVRLISSGVDRESRLHAGIEIALAPGWKTYWRSPGDAGVAPLFDFSASKNVRDLTVEFPVPHRYDDGFSVTNVYENRVVFPLIGTVDDTAKPVELSLDLTIGVCREICIPEQLTARLSVPTTEDDAAVDAILTQARSLVPGPAEPGVLAVTEAKRDGGTDKRPVFVFDTVVPDTDSAEIFVEGPPDWSPHVPKLIAKGDGTASYRVQFSRLGAKTPIEGATFRVTIVDDGRAVEDTVTLD